MSLVTSQLNIRSIVSPEIRAEFQSKVFEGFFAIVDPNIAQTVEEVIIFAVSSLYGLLESSNLVNLLKYAKIRNFRLKRIYRSNEVIEKMVGDISSEGVTKIILCDDIENILV